MDEVTTQDLLDMVMSLHYENVQGKLDQVSDEGVESVIRVAIDLLLPKATRMIRGDDWVLIREGYGE